MERGAAHHADATALKNSDAPPPRVRRRGRWRQVLARLRRDYFASAGESAKRYSVTLDRLVEHLEAQPGTPPIVRYVEELLLAVACLDGEARALRDLRSFEPLLLRTPRLGATEIDAAVRIRRFLALLEAAATTGATEASTFRSFAAYRGDRPLRLWLLKCMTEFDGTSSDETIEPPRRFSATS